MESTELGGARSAGVTVTFSAAVFSLEAVKRAAYRLTDRFSFDVIVSGDQIVCEVVPLCGMSPEELRRAEGRFRNEVLDQDLRERIAEETSPIRNVILAYAFSGSGLQTGE